MKESIYLIVGILCLAACHSIKTIAPDQYQYLPYKGDEVLYLSDSIATDSLKLCGYFNDYTYWESGITKRHQEVRFLRCSEINTDCAPGENRFLAYLFFDKNQNLGLGININIKKKKYFFGVEVLLKDSARYKQHADHFDKDMLVIKDEDASDTGSVIDAVYWDLQNGLQAIRLNDGRLIIVSNEGRPKFDTLEK